MSNLPQGKSEAASVLVTQQIQAFIRLVALFMPPSSPHGMNAIGTLHNGNAMGLQMQISLSFHNKQKLSNKTRSWLP